MRKRTIVCVVFFLFCSSQVVLAETSGWSWGGLFSSTTTTEPAGVQEKAPKSWVPDWKMPDVAGSMKKATNSVTRATSNAWNATTKTTKQAWKKTTTALDPFPDKKVSSPPPVNKPKGGFMSWFSGKPSAEERPQTVQDFLRQERLQ